jgi:hypothetical protein
MAMSSLWPAAYQAGFKSHLSVLGLEMWLSAHLKNLQVSFEDDLHGQWRNGHVDHLEEQSEVGKESAHCGVPADASERIWSEETLMRTQKMKANTTRPAAQ